MKKTKEVSVQRADLEECLDRATRILKQSKFFPGAIRNELAERKIRLALLKLASLSRRKWKESRNDGNRVELRDLLENAGRLATRLSQVLSDERFVKALQLPPIKEEVRCQLHNFEISRPEIISEIQKLASSIPFVLAALQLSGKAGRSRPFHAVEVHPKVLLSIYARRIFTELGITTRPPSARNERFIDFLNCVWMLALYRPEPENDWSTPIKIAARQRKTGAGPIAYLLPEADARDFAEDLLCALQMGALLSPTSHC